MQSFVEVGEKRIREEGTSEDLYNGEKIRTGLSSLPEVFKHALVDKSLIAQLMGELEPLIRKLVREELEDGRRLPELRSPRRMQIRPRMETPEFRLSFSKPISAKIFTQMHVKDSEGGQLQISVERLSRGSWGGPTVALPSSVRVELVVLEGHFSPDENGDWVQEEFEKSVTKEREERRPLMVGSTSLVVTAGGPTTIPELIFTDNSSWVRSKRFRIGARPIVDSSHEGLRIKEAITNPFEVKDNRGRSWEKHYPPRLEDDVWRLERIGKNGKFHEKLSKSNINNVQDFLKLLSVDPSKLKQILGMCEKSWEKTVDHASTCLKGSKLYLMENPGAVFFFNSTCELEAALVNDHLRDLRNFPGEIMEPGVDLKLEAYKQWDSLQVVERSWFDNVLIQNGVVLPIDNVAGSPSRDQLNNQAKSSQFMDKQIRESELDDDEESDSWDLSVGSSEWRPLNI